MVRSCGMDVMVKKNISAPAGNRTELSQILSLLLTTEV
jgi:hypothetical protein